MDSGRPRARATAGAEARAWGEARAAGLRPGRFAVRVPQDFLSWQTRSMFFVPDACMGLRESACSLIAAIRRHTPLHVLRSWCFYWATAEG